MNAGITSQPWRAEASPGDVHHYRLSTCSEIQAVSGCWLAGAHEKEPHGKTQNVYLRQPIDVKENQREDRGMKKSTALALGKLNLRKLSSKRRRKIARLAIERRWRTARAQEKKTRKQYDRGC
jgi:hypothetical protein